MKSLTLLLLLLITSCDYFKEEVDLLVINANIYTVDEDFSKAEAFAVTDGKFVAVGSSEEIQKRYTSDQIVNAKKMTISPGLIDAHCHFYRLGLTQQVVDLVGTKSYDEVLERVKQFQNKHQKEFILGRGWDQNDWEIKKFPTKKELDALFPKTPVALERIDGHAYLVNQAALDKANIKWDTKVTGGEIFKNEFGNTGILVDNPMQLIDAIIPAPSLQEKVQALKDAERICLSYGLTTVSDAGLDRSTIELIDSLQQNGALSIRVYAMVSNTPENLSYYLNRGPFKTEKLNVRSVKVYGDGALGSRGAALKKPYSDKIGHYGAMVTPTNEIVDLARRIAISEYQMNTHAIGDSANSFVLQTYNEVLKGQKDRRWRVEHAQVIEETDFDYFKNGIIPSIQPTHATSDMYWAEDRLGPERVKSAYAFKKLLDKAGRLALGTDFPVEQVNPFLTFYAAIARKDTEGYPTNGFQMQDVLTREETLKGMTIWAAYSNFEDHEKGSIEVGKFADFTIYNEDIMTIPASKIVTTTVKKTYIDGVVR